MIKYILCILLGVVLTSGLGTISDQDSQRSRTEVGTVGLESCTQSNYQVSGTVVKQSSKENSSVGDEKCNGKYNCKISDGVPGSPFYSRTLPPTKNLRFNASSTVIQILSSFKSQLSQVKRTELSSYVNPTKSSYRYYVYTLGRILI